MLHLGNARQYFRNEKKEREKNVKRSLCCKIFEFFTHTLFDRNLLKSQI